MSLTTEGMTPADLAAVTRSNDSFGSGNGYWLLFFFIICMMGWNGGAWNGGANSYQTSTVTQADMQRGFDQQAVIGHLDGINSTISNGFSNAEVSRCNQQANILQTLNGNNSAVLQQLNEMAYNQLGNANGTQAGIADLKYTIATENCADRNALSQSLMQLQSDNRANTQAIIDKLNQQELDNVRRENENLRQQLNFAQLTASQNQQTGQLMNDNAMQTQNLVRALGRQAPVPAYVVPNPYCNCDNSTSSGGTRANA